MTPTSSWSNVETAKCVRCAIYTPMSDLRISQGRAYCVGCGVPSIRPPSKPKPRATPTDDLWETKPVSFSPFESFRAPWGTATPIGPQATQTIRVIGGLIALVMIAFPLAACVSQL